MTAQFLFIGFITVKKSGQTYAVGHIVVEGTPDPNLTWIAVSPELQPKFQPLKTYEAKVTFNGRYVKYYF